MVRLAKDVNNNEDNNDNRSRKLRPRRQRRQDSSDVVVKGSAADLDVKNPVFDNNLDNITGGDTGYVKKHLLTQITYQNCKTIVDYILAFQIEVNPSRNYRFNTISTVMS
ncbi:MAG: hypothetical protein M3258_02925, partial [Thermoproteota archaeon]|nr:hypothetical protein [Thermoproteota archaeon]